MRLADPIRRLWGASRTPRQHQRQWTIVIVPEGSDATRTLHLSRSIVRVAAAVAFLAVTVVGVAGVSIGLDMTGRSPFADAGARHQARVLTTLRSQLATLRDTVTRM